MSLQTGQARSIDLFLLGCEPANPLLFCNIMYTHPQCLSREGGGGGNMSNNGRDVWPINGNKLQLSSLALLEYRVMRGNLRLVHGGNL